MKTINSKKEAISTFMAERRPLSKSMRMIGHRGDFSEKHPCWYSNFIPGNSKEDYEWQIGCYSEQDGKDEICFKPSSIGDVNNNEFWEVVSSYDFAKRLLDAFKAGGKGSVQEILDNMG